MESSRKNILNTKDYIETKRLKKNPSMIYFNNLVNKEQNRISYLENELTKQVIRIDNEKAMKSKSQTKIEYKHQLKTLYRKTQQANQSKVLEQKQTNINSKIQHIEKMKQIGSLSRLSLKAKKENLNEKKKIFREVKDNLKNEFIEGKKAIKESIIQNHLYSKQVFYKMKISNKVSDLGDKYSDLVKPENSDINSEIPEEDILRYQNMKREEEMLMNRLRETKRERNELSKNYSLKNF